MSKPTTLVRNRDVVHQRGCRYNVAGTPWEWAEGKTVEEVYAARRNGLKFCKVCKPLSALPSPGGAA